MDTLQQLLDEGVIDEVFNQLKTGKEAEVWLVSHHGEPCAAKIYKAREFRNFKNDAGYKEGRQVRNTRTQRAMDKGSKFGRASAEEAWKSMEADTMFALHAAGVRVPKPIMFYEGVLLMEVIGDAEGRVAPRLVEAVIPKELADAMYVTLRQEVIKMLAEDVIHGDLSEFNILLGAHGPVIIDFPQVITAAKNSQSEKYFRRDLGNLLRFFSAIDPAIAQRHASDADEIWREYVRRDLSPGFVPSGRSFQRGPFQQGGGRGGGGGARRDGPQQGGPRGPQGDRRDGSRPGGGQRFGGGPRSDAPQQGGGAPREGQPQGGERSGGNQRFDGPPRRGEHFSGGPRREGPQQGGGPRREGPQQGGGPRREGPQQGGGPRREGPQQGGGPRREGPQQGGGPRREGQPQGGRGDPRFGGRGGRPQGPVVEKKPDVGFRPPPPNRHDGSGRGH